MFDFPRMYVEVTITGSDTYNYQVDTPYLQIGNTNEFVWFNEQGLYENSHNDYPAIIFKNDWESYYEWRKNGKLHREDAPALMYYGHGTDSSEYWINGILHRMDGPAVIRKYHDGDIQNHWIVNGNNITLELEEFCETLSIDVDNMTNDDRTVVIMFLSRFI